MVEADISVCADEIPFWVVVGLVAIEFDTLMGGLDVADGNDYAGMFKIIFIEVIGVVNIDSLSLLSRHRSTQREKQKGNKINK